MKKVLLILLTVAYSIAAIGVNFQFFYCCNKLSDISLSQSMPSNNIEPVSKTTRKGCCGHSSVNIRITSDQDKQVAKANLPTAKVLLLPILQYPKPINQYKNFVCNKAKYYPIYPPPNRPHATILYCNFRV